MNPQEQSQLEQFLQGLVSAQGVQKLQDADQLIRQALARQPDAGYLLVQRCMLLERALTQAKAQLAAQQDAAPSSRSFFEGGYQTSPGARPTAPTAPAAYAPAGGPAYGAPAYGAAPTGGSGAGSFLGQAAATAAGVAGGAFLFEGLEHLLGSHDMGYGAGGFEPVSNENVTVNNFYDGQNDERHESTSDDNSMADDDQLTDNDADFDDDPNAGDGSSWT